MITLEKENFLLDYDVNLFKVSVYRDTKREDKRLLNNRVTEYYSNRPLTGNELSKELSNWIEIDKKTEFYSTKINK